MSVNDAKPAPIRRDCQPKPAQPPAAPPIPSTTIMQGTRCVAINHRGVIYRLQETQLGKLILTK